MTFRHMYDAIHANVDALVSVNPSMVALYLTGSASIRWTPADVAKFPHATFVRIDQGGPTSPQYEANVFDVETGAWSLAGAEAALAHCTAPVPTLYLNRSTLASYSGSAPVWLAAPGLTDAEAVALAATDKRIVAVQNVWSSAWDRSVVIDAVWPAKSAPGPKPVPHPGPSVACTITWQGSDGQVTRQANVPAGAWKQIKWVPPS